MADRKIDVHAHFISPAYRQALADNGYIHIDGMPGIPAWSVESHLAYMDAHGIEKSILSVSSPGTSISSDPILNQRLARETNTYAAEIKSSNPKRFGYFASLPLPDVPASIAEIEHVLDGPLKADGITLLSNSSGYYLGDLHLKPVLEALDSRNAIVFTHPTSPCLHGSHNQQSAEATYPNSAPLAPVYDAPMFEFLFDSARSDLDLLLSGTASRFDKIRWIITHCGGVLPSLLDRMFLFVNLGPPFDSYRDPGLITEEQIRKALAGQFWFDLAGNSVPNMVEALLKFTGKERLLFGTDVPWTPFEGAGKMIRQQERRLPGCVGEEFLDMVYWGNAEKLLSDNDGGEEK